MGESIKFFLEGPSGEVRQVKLHCSHYRPRQIIEAPRRKAVFDEDEAPEFLDRTFIDQEGRLAAQASEDGDIFHFATDPARWHLVIG
jgi:hypothetical protein